MGEVKSWTLCVKVSLSFFCIFLILLSGFYFYYLSVAITGVLDITAVIIYSISALVIILIGLIGLYSTYRRKTTLLTYFTAINFLMFLLGVVQVGLAGWSLDNCQNLNNPFIFICNISLLQASWEFWLPTVAIMVLNIFCFIFSIILLQIWKKEEGGGGKENYY